MATVLEPYASVRERNDVMPFLSEAERSAVLWKVVATVERKFADPKLNGVDLRGLAQREEGSIAKSDSPEEFEQRVNALLQQLGSSHLGFFHESRPRSPGRIAVAATFAKGDTPDGIRWVFQDVHAGGVAALAGIRPGDVLLTLDDRDVIPPDVALFELGKTYAITVRRSDETAVRKSLAVPNSKDKKRPLVVPDQVVSASRLDGDIAHIKVSMFPGMLGIDVARDTTQAIKELNCPKLIIDLRGNTGGGMGCLRLMSHMCADKRGVGYSVGRSLIKKGCDKDRLPRFDHIPGSKLGILPLIGRFAFAGRSVAIFTEGLGPQLHLGRVVLLLNEHSASASEMVAAFASEYRLATLVGVKTAGRLVAASSFKVGHGYRLALPVGAYFTWSGTRLEGHGVSPDVEAPLSIDNLRSGRDDQLAVAMEVLGHSRLASLE